MASISRRKARSLSSSVVMARATQIPMGSPTLATSAAGPREKGVAGNNRGQDRRA